MANIKPVKPTVIRDKRIIKAVVAEAQKIPSPEVIRNNKRYNALLKQVKQF